MHRSEARLLDTCAECGAEVDVSRDRAYAVDSQRTLCFDCAVRRGGSYDEFHDLWRSAPDLSGLRPLDRD